MRSSYVIGSSALLSASACACSCYVPQREFMVDVVWHIQPSKLFDAGRADRRQ